MSLAELQKALKQNKIVIGKRACLNGLMHNKLFKVYLSSTCDPSSKELFKKYSSINEVKIENLDKTSEEIGVVCKKPFSISVLAIKND